MPVLLVALLLSSPALWQACVDGTMNLETALIRFLVAMPVAAVMVFAFKSATASQKRRHASETLDATAEESEQQV
jgi:hypothetical protein